MTKIKKRFVACMLVALLMLSAVTPTFAHASSSACDHNGCMNRTQANEAELQAWAAQRLNRGNIQHNGGSERGMPVSVEVFSQDGYIERVEVPIDPLQIPFEVAPHTQFEVVPIRYNGPDTENVVITILGDGFTAAEQNRFIEAATLVADEIVAFHPFSSFADAINVYAIKVISNESGARRDHLTDSNYRPNVDNFFRSTFWADGVTQRLLYPAHWPTNDFVGINRVIQVTQAHTPVWDVIVLLVNTTTFGGAGGAFAVSSITAGSAAPITIHELGHSVGGLADEYWWVEGGGGSPGEYPNRTTNNDPNTMRWRHWLDVDHSGMSVPPYHGIFPFAESGVMNRFRPHQGCMMRWAGMPFCYVCSSALVRRMAFLNNEEFHGQSLLTSIVLPEGTARIVDYAFWGSESLTEVTIPASVTSIGRFAFLRNTGLERVTLFATTPPDINGNDRFYGVDRSNIDLFVPVGTTSAYLAAGWTGFRAIFEMGDAPSLHMVTYDANGGIGTMSAQGPYERGYIVTAGSSAFTNPGHIQIGWRLDHPIRGATVPLESSFVIQYHATLYALWMFVGL
ncbi:MAG: M64 family metallo-endopeptidase [Oscillospiraceae bacterium]|nr:M64 family metallo-endopeptidase [Oscillospiraceae bacterium]